MKNFKKQLGIAMFILAIFIPQVQAQSTDKALSVDVSDPGFKLTVCDGPKLPTGVTPPFPDYRECNFNTFMLQVQRLINVLLVVGVLAATLLFCYAGYLLIKGSPDSIKQAKNIFQKAFFGFIIMLSAWFIVYQLLSWLTGNSGFASLLGSPT
ncbi:MAG: pilin [Candidatus Paceibacterota bacterium]|jgi:hypothetical protein